MRLARDKIVGLKTTKDKDSWTSLSSGDGMLFKDGHIAFTRGDAVLYVQSRAGVDDKIYIGNSDVLSIAQLVALSHGFEVQVVRRSKEYYVVKFI